MPLEVLPNEILNLMAKDLKVKDLSALLRTTKFFARLLEPQLHRLAAQDVGKLSALSWAAGRGHGSLVRLLLGRGVDVNIHDNDFMNETTALHQAALYGHAAIVQLLLENGAEVDSRVFMGSTALHWAVQHGHVEAVRILLENGANLGIRNAHQRTPLQMAVVSRHGLEKRFLEGKGFVPVNQRSREEIRQKVEQIAVAVVITLLEYGADTRIRDMGGKTILHLAVSHARQWGDFDTIPRLLLDFGAEPGVLDNDGWTELHTAIYRGRKVLVNLLLERNIDLENPAERTPLRLAVRLGNPDIARSLLEKGANVEAQDQNGRTALHCAARGGVYDRNDHLPEYQPKIPWELKSALISLLLEKGANVYAQDNNGFTALHHAIDVEDLAAVNLLLGLKLKD